MSDFRVKFSAIAHSDHDYCNPIGHQKMEQVIDVMDLPSGARALDVGCGKAALLIRLAERCAMSGVGVDLSLPFIEAARREAARRVPEADLVLEQGDGATFPFPATFDLAVCMGARPFGDGYRATLEGLKQRVSPGGLVLVGEGFWERPPGPQLLEFLACDAGDQTTHGANVALGAELGLTPLYACVASQGEWDHYEGRYLNAVERYGLDHPDDPDTPRMLERIRRWRTAYYDLMRGVLGFGLYLFRR